MYYDLNCCARLCLDCSLSWLWHRNLQAHVVLLFNLPLSFVKYSLKCGTLVIFCMGFILSCLLWIHLDCHAGCPPTGLAAAGTGDESMSTWNKRTSVKVLQDRLSWHHWRYIHILLTLWFITLLLNLYYSKASTVPSLISRMLNPSHLLSWKDLLSWKEFVTIMMPIFRQ